MMVAATAPLRWWVLCPDRCCHHSINCQVNLTFMCTWLHLPTVILQMFMMMVAVTAQLRRWALCSDHCCHHSINRQVNLTLMCTWLHLPTVILQMFVMGAAITRLRLLVHKCLTQAGRTAGSMWWMRHIKVHPTLHSPSSANTEYRTHLLGGKGTTIGGRTARDKNFFDFIHLVV